LSLLNLGFLVRHEIYDDRNILDKYKLKFW